VRFRAGALAVALAVGLSWTATAFAGDPTKLAAAQALFEEGRALVAKQDFAAAALRFEESQKLDPGAGTLLQLARCYESLGRTASAWGTYHEAASVAAQGGRKDWETLANTRAAALEPKLSQLTIVVTEMEPGLSVTRDGVVVPPSLLASRVPVDPGKVRIAATATGRAPFATEVIVAGPGSYTATIPKLSSAPAASATSTSTNSSTNATPSMPRDQKNSTNVGPIVVVALGGAAVATGAIFGLVAMNANSTSKEKCPTPRCADREGVDANDRAASMGTLSTIFVGAGAAVALGGLAWLYLARPARTAIVPSVSHGSVALGLRGTFE